MVTLTDSGLVEISRLITSNGGYGTRRHKRVGLKIALFLRRPFNSSIYAKAVETVDISANGLLVLCDVNLELGADLEVTNINRDVIVVAVVKHSSRDMKTGKYLLGLSITEKKTDWFVQEPTIVPSIALSLATEAIC